MPVIFVPFSDLLFSFPLAKQNTHVFTHTQRKKKKRKKQEFSFLYTTDCYLVCPFSLSVLCISGPEEGTLSPMCDLPRVFIQLQLAPLHVPVALCVSHWILTISFWRSCFSKIVFSNFNVHINHLGILSTSGWFKRPWRRPENLHSDQALEDAKAESTRRKSLERAGGGGQRPSGWKAKESASSAQSERMSGPMTFRTATVGF